MAVQAQYPSNVLLLNRNVQEGQDYSLQPGGIFLDQSHALVNNGGATNQRKRGREICPDNNVVGSASSMNVYSVSMQPHQQQKQQQTTQLIDLSQLHNNSVSTGLRLAFADQQNHNHHHHQHQQQHHHQQQQKVVDNSSAILSLFKEELTTHVRQQRDEIDQCLQAQGEQLRRSLAEKRQRHYRALLGAAEETLARRLREKEAEVEKAKRRNADLQARAAQLGAEAQIWQARARSQEAEAASLRAHIQQAVMGCGGANDGRKADSYVAASEGGQGAAEDAESVYVDPERAASLSEPSCKACRRRAATVLMLPCRHLSVCTECERVAHTCPLCFRPRSSSIEIYLP